MTVPKADNLEIGHSIGHYRITKKIGAGGMGEVYLAQDTKLDRQVALKILPEEFTKDADRLHRFEREAKAASALNHPNIITIYEIGQRDDSHYIATEYIAGETLRSRTKEKRLDLDETLNISIQVAEALAAAHLAGIIHRDIKPENIMVRPDGYVKVLDFGLAKLLDKGRPSVLAESEDATVIKTGTEPGKVMGTAAYMSPEQARGKDIDARSDIFSFGILLYELVAGRNPFTGETPSDILVALISKEVVPVSRHAPEIPADLQHIISKALRKDRDERYQSMKSLLVDLKNLRREHEFELKLERSVNPQDEDSGQTLIKPKSAVSGTLHKSTLTNLSHILRRPRVPVWYILVGLVVVVGTLWIAWGWWQPRLHAPSAEAQKLFDKGVEALREGAYYQASIAFEQSVGADNQFALAHARLGEALMELDYTDRARNELLLVSQLVPDRSAMTDKDKLYLDAVVATIRRDFPRAVKSYEQLSNLSPDQPQAYVDLGRAYVNNEETTKAIDSYLKATILDDTYAAAFLRVGILYGRKQELPAADSAFGKADQLYQAAGNVEGRTEVLYQRGALSLSSGNHIEALASLQHALEMSRVTNNQAQQIRVLLQLALALQSGGDTAQAQQAADDALRLAQSSGMQNLVMRGLVDFGSLYLMKGNYPEADKYFKQALALAQEKNALRNVARASLSLASLRIQQGIADEAVQYIQQALPFYQEGNYTNETSQALLLLGRSNYMKGDYDAALKAFREQLQLAEEAGNSLRKSLSHEGIGTVLYIQERFTEAIEHFQQAYVMDKNDNRTGEVGIDLINKATMSWQLGNYDEAQANLAEADSIAAQSGGEYEFLLSILDQARAEMALAERRFSEAKLKSQKVLVTDKDLTDRDKIDLKRILGVAQLLSGEKRAGKLSCEEAFKIASRQSDPWLLSKTLLALAEAQLETGDTQGALKSALKAQEIFLSSGQQASEWRATLLAARASFSLGDQTVANEYVSSASSTLSKLEQRYGSEAFNTYANRPDVQYCRKQLSGLSVIQR